MVYPLINNNPLDITKESAKFFCVILTITVNILHFVFGNLAILAACAALDPMALRRQLSLGLPFRTTGCFKIPCYNSASQGIDQARLLLTQLLSCIIFGNLAIMVTCVTLDPMALRSRFSPVLLFSDFPSVSLSVNYIKI